MDTKKISNKKTNNYKEETGWILPTNVAQIQEKLIAQIESRLDGWTMRGAEIAAMNSVPSHAKSFLSRKTVLPLQGSKSPLGFFGFLLGFL